MDTDARIRQALLVNVVLTVPTALALVALAGPLDDLLGTGHPGIVRAVGAGLLLFAIDVALARRLRGNALRRATLAVAAVDVAWVVASLGTIAAGWYDTIGAVLVAAVALAVAGLAALELRAVGSREPAIA